MRYKDLVANKLEKMEGNVKKVTLFVNRGESRKETIAALQALYDQIQEVKSLVDKEQ